MALINAGATIGTPYSMIISARKLTWAMDKCLTVIL